ETRRAEGEPHSSSTPFFVDESRLPIRSARYAASLATIRAARRPACAALEGRASIGRTTASPAEDVVASRGDRLVVGQERANRALRFWTVPPHSGVRRPRSKPLTELAVRVQPLVLVDMG